MNYIVRIIKQIIENRLIDINDYFEYDHPEYNKILFHCFHRSPGLYSPTINLYHGNIFNQQKLKCFYSPDTKITLINKFLTFDAITNDITQFVLTSGRDFLDENIIENKSLYLKQDKEYKSIKLDLWD